MPAVRAASGLAPAAFSWKPRVVRSRSHHTTTAATTASSTPVCTPNREGKVADLSTGSERGFSCPARLNASALLSR